MSSAEISLVLKKLKLLEEANSSKIQTLHLDPKIINESLGLIWDAKKGQFWNPEIQQHVSNAYVHKQMENQFIQESFNNSSPEIIAGEKVNSFNQFKLIIEYAEFINQQVPLPNQKQAVEECTTTFRDMLVHALEVENSKD